MRWIGVIALLGVLSGCVAHKPETTAPRTTLPVPQIKAEPSTNPLPDDLERQLAQALDIGIDVDHFERFEVVPIPTNGATPKYAAICDWQANWWGNTCVFEVADGMVANLQRLDQGEQSMHRIRCVTISTMKEPVLELYGKTHMGHGAYYLYRVTPNSAELLVETDAVDYHEDLDVLWGGVLSAAYRDLNADGFDDIELTGTRQYAISDKEFEDKGYSRRQLIRKVFLYDHTTGEFTEDKSRRAGTRYQDT